MHPNDERYKEYTHGQKIDLEWINGPITATIIKDEAADMETGSGVMTITPWHSTVDYEIAQRHGLDKEQVIDNRGILLPIAGDFVGEHIKKARTKIVERLAQKGLVDHIDEKYTHRVATNSRGGGVIEPQIMKQWFIDVEKEFTPPNTAQKTTLKKWMREVVEDGKVEILPDHFKKTYYHWIDNLRPWCISRQIWFGHRIPVWYRSTNAHGKSDQEIYVGVDAPKGEGWTQDEDTLDTWFSSGLWTFSTLGWPASTQGGPEKTEDLEIYHPTSLLETGYDILFFWIARMILMSGALLGEVPFKQVYLHGLVRDEKGRKMSKSIGNIIDPLDMITKYGADATRLSLIIGAAPGNDIKLSEMKVKGYKHFANKLWNVTRFVLQNTEDTVLERSFEAYTEADTTLRAERHALIVDVTKDLEEYRLYIAAEKLYHFVWHRLADEIIEESKPILAGTDEAAKHSRKQLLLHTLEKMLIVLHPFMPFVTEEIWSSFSTKDANMLIVTPWPVVE
jgi:valyl-tRNA synthetase